MKRLPLILIVLGILGTLSPLLLSPKNPFADLSFEPQRNLAAKNIVSHFKDNRDALSAEKRGHFFVRLYRLSGENPYLPEIRTYAERLSTRFKTHAQNLNSPEYIQQTAEHFLELPENPLIKHRYRAKYRSRWPEMAFAHRLLFLAFQIKSFGLHKTTEFEKILSYLKQLSYEDYLLNEDMIRYNSTRIVNMVYQLKFLGLADYETVFTEKFKTLFFQKSDRLLDRTLYMNKIYGLTHLVIAASDFYQHPVSSEKFAWVLDSFETNLETLLIRNTPDTIAELAVCFKLAGQENHPAVARIQKFLLQKFDPKHGYFPSDRKEFTLDAIEHRNILAYMALTDWQNLYAGPDLSKQL